MKKWHEELPFDFSNPMTDKLFTEHTLLFDIETTGFSPAHTSLYLIGCAVRAGNRLVTDQFFAENSADEKNILEEFLSLQKNYDTVITYNGLGFDIPYLKAKCGSLGLPEHFSDCTYIDLYKSVSQLKFLLKLPDYKLKTIESFLGIKRDDTYSGNKLIDIYQEYQKDPTEDALFYLRQHNLEDVIAMPSLLPLFAYIEFFNGNYSITSIDGNEYTDAQGNLQKELYINMKNDYDVPKRVSCSNALFYLTMHKDNAQIRIPLFEKELKFFFEDYKNYYYLPKEDRAVHKSIGSYADRKDRVQALASNCYTRKYAIFVPQQQEIMTPSFRESLKDKLSYFELTDDFTESDIMLRRYTDHILNTLSNSSKQDFPPTRRAPHAPS